MLHILSKETMVGINHLKSLEKDIKYINDNNINGAIVECGVWKGGCISWMMYCQKNIINKEKFIYMIRSKE